MAWRQFIIALLLPVVSSAQTNFGLKTGLNLSDIVMTNYVNPDVESDLRIRPGLHAGFFVSGMVSENIGLAAELLYSDQGVKGATNIHLHYVTLPLMIRYPVTDRVTAELGPAPSYLFAAMSRHGDVSGTYNNKLDVSLDGGFELAFSKLLIGIRYCVGMLSVREPGQTIGSSGIEKIKYQNRVLQFSIGYKLYTLE